MKLIFSQSIADYGKTIRLPVKNKRDLNEQIFHDQLLPIFYKVTPGLDDDTGRLIPGHKIDETLIGPRFLMSEPMEDGLNHIVGITVHDSMFNDLVSELSKLGHTVES